MASPHLSASYPADSFLFVSGQLAFDAERKLVSADVGGQTRQVLENLRAILAGEGLSLNDVVKTTVWLTQEEDFGLFNETYAEMFGDHGRPAHA